MRGGIVQCACPVACARHHLPCGIDHNSAHRHFAACSGSAGLFQSDIHKGLRRHDPMWPQSVGFRKQFKPGKRAG